MKKVIILIVLMLGCVAFESKAQKIALKIFCMMLLLP